MSLNLHQASKSLEYRVILASIQQFWKPAGIVYC